MMFDSHAYYGQPSVSFPQFPPQSLFGALPGQYGPPSAQALAACLGHQLLGGAMGQPIRYLDGGVPTPVPTAFAPHGVLGALAAQYGLPQYGLPMAAQGLFGALPAPHGLTTGPAIGGGWPTPAQPQFAGFAPQALFGALPVPARTHGRPRDRRLACPAPARRFRPAGALPRSADTVRAAGRGGRRVDRPPTDRGYRASEPVRPSANAVRAADRGHRRTAWAATVRRHGDPQLPALPDDTAVGLRRLRSRPVEAREVA